MLSSMEWFSPATAACLALAAVSFVLAAVTGRRGLRVTGLLLLLAGAAALVAAVALPALLPSRSGVLNADGSTDDPRVLSALVAGLAALAATLPAWRALRLRPATLVGVALPGLAIAGLLGSVVHFAGLRSPIGLGAITVGGLALGAALALLPRAPRPLGAALAQAAATALVAVTVAIALHGARATGIELGEGAPVDTLGLRVSLAGVDATAPDARAVSVDLAGPGGAVRLQPALRRAAGEDWRSVADARPFGGPLVLPLKLREQRAHAHEITWIARGDTLRLGDVSVRFTGFRIEQTDSIRMYADLVVDMPGGIRRAAPGVIATPEGQIPFAAEVEGFGRVAVARLDPDHHRAGLVLPQPAAAEKHYVALVDVRQRPALRWAWGSLAVALAAAVAALALRGPEAA
jgi:hypothetical protein